MGDFNIDYLNGSRINNKWKHIVETLDLHELVNTSARITAHSETIIDHIYASRPDNTA